MSFKERYEREHWDHHFNITHKPTGFKFYQAGGRIVVLQKGEDDIYRFFADFTNNDLLIDHTVLTEAALRKAAVTWLKDNQK